MAALIECPNCSKLISSEASMCPNCRFDPHNIKIGECGWCKRPIIKGSDVVNGMHPSCAKQNLIATSTDAVRFSCPTCNHNMEYKNYKFDAWNEKEKSISCSKCAQPISLKVCPGCRGPIAEHISHKLGRDNHYHINCAKERTQFSRNNRSCVDCGKILYFPETRSLFSLLTGGNRCKNC